MKIYIFIFLLLKRCFRIDVYLASFIFLVIVTSPGKLHAQTKVQERYQHPRDKTDQIGLTGFVLSITGDFSQLNGKVVLGAPPVPETRPHHLEGWGLGVSLAYYMALSSWVMGGEIEFHYPSLPQQKYLSPPLSNPLPLDRLVHLDSADVVLTYLYHFRFRLGYRLTERLMVHGHFGYSLAQGSLSHACFRGQKHAFLDSAAQTSLLKGVRAFTASHLHAYHFGMGIDYAITSHLFARLEYMYAPLKAQEWAIYPPLSHNTGLDKNILSSIRLGLLYRF